MSRLTKREKAQLSNGEECVICNHEKADCNDSCMYGRCKWNKKAIEKLKAYEDKEKQELLILLPCKVGTVVWQVRRTIVGKRFVKEGCDHLGVKGYEESVYDYVIQKIPFSLNNLKDFGKTVFFTEAEAEEALAKMGGK